jgi:hypothetical protein
MSYWKISKEMSSLYFGLALFCLFEARVPEFDTQPLPPNSCGLTPVSNSKTLASKWQKTSSPKYNDDISLQILQYLISAGNHPNCCFFSEDTRGNRITLIFAPCALILLLAPAYCLIRNSMCSNVYTALHFFRYSI